MEAIDSSFTLLGRKGEVILFCLSYTVGSEPFFCRLGSEEANVTDAMFMRLMNVGEMVSVKFISPWTLVQWREGNKESGDLNLMLFCLTDSIWAVGVWLE